MAISASVVLNPSSSITKDKVIMAKVTVTNSGLVDVNVTQVVPQCTIVGNGPMGSDNPSSTVEVCQLPASPVVAASGGTLDIVFPIAFHAPSNQFAAFSVGALVYSSDGQLVAATPASITVTNP